MRTDSNSKKTPKPKVGKLWYGDKLIAGPLPFPQLQNLKKSYIATGNWDKDNFKITY